MRRLFRSFVYPVVFCLAASVSSAEDRTFLFPSGGSNIITVLDAADLAFAGSVPASVSTFKILATPRGTKYYMLSRTGADAIVVVDVQTLDVIKRIHLTPGVSDALVTPDGEYLVATAGKLRIFSTETDEQIGDGIDVGSGPQELEVNQRSTRAYVLASAGQAISVVDLTARAVLATIDTPNTKSIGLVEPANQLVALQDDGLQTYDLGTYEERAFIPESLQITNGTVIPIPGTARVFVQNRGSSPRNTSQVFDLINSTVLPVGLPGAFGISQVAFASADRAFAILADQEDLAELDLTAASTIGVTPLGIGFAARSLSIAPNGKTLYVSSLSASTIVRYDVTTATVTHTGMPAIAPSRNTTIFAPAPGPPATIKIVGGQNQFIPPGLTTPLTLTVRVADDDDNPLFDVPVFFTAPTSEDVDFDVEQPVRTNSLGIAAVNVLVTPAPPPAALKDEVSEPAPLRPVALQDALAPTSALLTVDPPAGSGDDVIEVIPISAVTSGGLSALFNLNVIRVAGIQIVSGNYQTTFPIKPFGKPFVIVATDETGKPLPAGTEILFSPFGASCGQIIVPLDGNGFASVECVGDNLPPNVPYVQEGTITTSVLDMLELGTATFDLSVSIGAELLELINISGDGQSGETDKPLAAPLVFRLESPYTGLGAVLTGIEIVQEPGGASPAIITPRFVAVRQNVDTPVSVILGPRAGPVVIRATVSSPRSPSVTYTIDAIGGLPVRFEQEGNQQSGRIGRLLPEPLRLRVFNESDEVIRFPEVTWEIVSGDVELITGSDPDGATAAVQLGNTPGPILIRATIGNLVANFNSTATPSQPASITGTMGQGQTLQVGMVSEPLVVEVLEVNGGPAFGVPVDYFGPPNVELISIEEGGPVGNPLRLISDLEGISGVRVRLLGIPIALGPAGTLRKQTMSNVLITASVGAGLSTSFMIDVVGRDPVFETAGVVNAATFLTGVVPGSLASIFGVGLSEGVAGTVQAGGATTFAGTTVRFAGTPAPLLSITNQNGIDQINLQVPFEAPAGQVTDVEIDNNDTKMLVQGVPVFASQAGIFEVPVGGGATVSSVIRAADFSLITPANPAVRGEAVALFFTGGGNVAPAVGTGVPGSVEPSEMALPVEVEVDGRPATVLFSGYAPGFLGLFQANLLTPEDAECGTRSLLIRVGGVASPASTIAVACP